VPENDPGTQFYTSSVEIVCANNQFGYSLDEFKGKFLSLERELRDGTKFTYSSLSTISLGGIEFVPMEAEANFTIYIGVHNNKLIELFQSNKTQGIVQEVSEGIFRSINFF